MDEHVTKSELTSSIAELERKMEKGFSSLEKQISEIHTLIKVQTHTDLEKYDRRYLLREEAMQDAMNRLNSCEFRKACYPIVSEYLDSEDGKIKIGSVIDRHLESKRDNVSRWVHFVRLILGIIIAGGFLYGGGSLIKSNTEAQHQLKQSIEQLR